MSEMIRPLGNDDALTGDSLSKGSKNCAEKHSQRIARYSDCKKRSRLMADHILERVATPDSVLLGYRVKNCANYLVFNNYYTVNQIRLAKVSSCRKHLLCPFCARIRAANQVRRYLERFEVVMDKNPKLIPVMLTLTVKNGDDLSERFQHLVDSFKAYQERRRDWIKKGRGYNELCKADGGVFSYEVTNTGNGWHPHLHAVLLLNSYVDVWQLSQEWKEITGDSMIVDIRRLKPTNMGDMAEAFCEVFKYALKFSDMSLEDNFEAYSVLKGKRLQGAFGSLWGVKVPDKMTDELLDDLPYFEMFYIYKPGKGYDLEEIKEIIPPVEKIAREISDDRDDRADLGIVEGSSFLSGSFCTPNSPNHRTLPSSWGMGAQHPMLSHWPLMRPDCYIWPLGLTRGLTSARPPCQTALDLSIREQALIEPGGRDGASLTSDG